MLIYEVNLVVVKEIADAFAAWLKKHIDEVVRCGNFEKAEWYKSDKGEQTIHYYVKDRATLDKYLESHAPRLRKEGMEKFPNQFSATRRVLELREL